MPDTVPDLAALTARVNALSEDLNRHAELLDGLTDQVTRRIDDLNARLLNVPHKIVLPFSVALEGWVGGTVSPQVTLPIIGPGGPGEPRFVAVARGSMLVTLPHLSRINVFGASGRIVNVFSVPDEELASAAAREDPSSPLLKISLQRMRSTANAPESVVQLSHPFAPGALELEGVPIPGTEFVDNDRFKYIAVAELFMLDVQDDAVVIPQGLVELSAFHAEGVVT